MPIHPFDKEFRTVQSRINIAEREKIAIAAHREVRAVLKRNTELQRVGLADILIGSYARDLSIWPGKDVDVFGRLQEYEVRDIMPSDAYGLFATALAHYEGSGRLTRQPRSLKIGFGPDHPPSEASVRMAGTEYGWSKATLDSVIRNATTTNFDFSVDVVPAVRWDHHYGIPDVDRRSDGLHYLNQSWQRTSPVDLNELTSKRNRETLIAGKGAFVPTVKSIKQIKAHHLGTAKPSFLLFEFMLHQGFAERRISGETWADITASALGYISQRLKSVSIEPICDPVLGMAYKPMPTASEIETETNTFLNLARSADRALREPNRCQAAIQWRKIFGGNPCYEHLFPLPPGCRETGVAMGAPLANTAVGGTIERSFGGQ